RGDGCIGHDRRAARDRIADLPHLLDMRVVKLAEVVPDARKRWYDVRLIAAAGDDIMGTLLDAKMLATEVPADVHQLHRIQRTASAPWRGTRVGALTFESVLN